jgi:N utilization substance protein B
MSEENKPVDDSAATKKAPSAKTAGRRPPRRLSREFVLQGLYQWKVGGADEATIEASSQDVAGFDKADRNFFLRLLRGTLAQYQNLRAEIDPQVDRPFDELSPVEACILLIGTFELIHHPETPYRVIINECIELAKTYGGTDGHKYINGVLDKIAAKLRSEEVAARRQRS